MHSIGVFVFFCVFALATAKKPSHGKVVACPIMTESMSKNLRLTFPMDKFDYSLCSHVIVYDHRLLSNGKEIILSKEIKNIYILIFITYL